jgi:hypothetical protein
MTNSITVEFLDNNTITDVKQFKSLIAFQKEYPQYAYHQLRQVYLFTMQKSSTKQLQKNVKIYKSLKIFDSDSYLTN